MGEQQRRWGVPQWWQLLGVLGLVLAAAIWLYAILTQDSAVSVGSALFSSGVVLLVGAHIVTLLKRE